MLANSQILSRSLYADKAHRRNPSEAVVTLGEQISRSNTVCGKNSQILSRSLFADKAHRRNPSEAVVTYGEQISRSNTVCGQNSPTNGGVKVSTGILRYDKRVEPSNL